MSATPGPQTEPVKFNDANFDAEVLQSDRPVLVDFWADWCRPCHMVAPTIEMLANEHASVATVGKLNVDESPEVARKFEIRSIPTVLLFKQGRVVETLIGVQSPQAYQQALQRHLADG